MRTYIILWFLSVFLCGSLSAQTTNNNISFDHYQHLTYDQLYNAFKHPPESARPWVFWYWMQGAVSKAGITADLEAMKYAGIAGAYLMPIKDTTSPPLFQPAVRQLTPLWWDMMRHAFREADRLGLKIGMHVSDGFALAGGPWITPELSMQKVVWSRAQIGGDFFFNGILPQPPANENYYKDIAVYAYPTPVGSYFSTVTTIPKITTSTGADAQFLVSPDNQQNFTSADNCWIQYSFDRPFTCRSVIIRTNGNNYQAHRLRVEISNDGTNFREVKRLQAPRHGWQDTDEDVTHSIPAVTARYFRFVYNKAGSEPGSEDLDAAKWKQSLKLRGIELISAARINQYEAKNGSIWRVGELTTAARVPDDVCVPLGKIINLTSHMTPDGRLQWQVPPGQWTILRMGHTSTGHKNETAGGGKGLECDKFNPGAIKLQFDSWFGEAIKQAGPELAAKVLKVFHIDSWECGSQNWSPLFRDEFIKRRGYDPLTYLPAMAGIPVETAEVSERFLHDIRETIAELVVDTFYGNMAKLAHEKGCTFTAESVAPTMLSDGMLHYKQVDIPMGEYWLRSPTHDKPNDMLDAISGAHIYGKPIIQAEAFTELRMAWDEYPGMLKAIQDRNYALGINRLSYHVFMHNPWMDRKPGMTLDGVGLYFQRDQTWWKQGKAWVDYALRCQAILQAGKPVTDIAVFTGEELPRRSVLPDRLVTTLPGIFGAARILSEKTRLANEGEPLRELPAGVRHSANMADPEDWIDPLNGYAYDSFNPDALMQARMKNGNITLDGGAEYKLLVLPEPRPMAPSNDLMSAAVAEKIQSLIDSGAAVILNEQPLRSIGLAGANEQDAGLKKAASNVWKATAKQRVVHGPYNLPDFSSLSIQPDLVVTGKAGLPTHDIAWTHRESPGLDIYFISNQTGKERIVTLSLRVSGRIPELWDAVTGETRVAANWKIENGRTDLPVKLAGNGSLFIVFSKPADKAISAGNNWEEPQTVQVIDGRWEVQFDPSLGGPAQTVTFDRLSDWGRNPDTAIRYYSGNAVYTKTFKWKRFPKGQRIFIDMAQPGNIASVTLNGMDCGVVWTDPYRLDITDALQKGKNKLEITVANTWANRLIGDERLPKEKRITQTTAPIRIGGEPLLPAGLMGPVKLVSYQ